jgi:hypothetical protein
MINAQTLHLVDLSSRLNTNRLRVINCDQTSILARLPGMNLYWVYDLPSWLFGLLAVVVTAAVGLTGLYATRKWVRRIHGNEHSHNDIVGYYLGAGCLFYGIKLARLAVGTWQRYKDVGNEVSEEVLALAGRYRNVSGFPDPERSNLGWRN